MIPWNQFFEVVSFSSFTCSPLFFSLLFLLLSFLVHAVLPISCLFCLCSPLWWIIIHCCNCEFRTIIVSRSLRSVSNTLLNEGLQVPLAFFVTRSSEGRHSSNRLICSRFSLFLSTVLAPYPAIRRCGQNNFLLIYNGILEATVL